ncbi:MAG: hypothetical protein AAF462_08940 [Thermodesulfobacteriota bacterium]
MSKNIWDEFIAEKECFIVPRELRLKRKALGLNNEEYIILLDCLDCYNNGVQDLDQHLAHVNGISEKTVQKRLGALEKKGFLRRDLRLVDGRIKGLTYNPEPLIKKLELNNSTGSLHEHTNIKSAHESLGSYESQNGYDEVKEKNWKNEFCSTKWYNDVFSEMYEEASGQPVLTGGREYKSAETYFSRLRQLNPELSAQDVYRRASEGARYIIDSQLAGGVFGWLHKPPDICMLANQAQAVDYQLRCIERTYGEGEFENKKCSVELLFTNKNKEKDNASNKFEKVYREITEIEHREVQRDFQKSNGERLSEDKS